MTGDGEDGIKVRSALLDMLLEANEKGENLSDTDIRDEVNTFMFEVRIIAQIYRVVKEKPIIKVTV